MSYRVRYRESNGLVRTSRPFGFLLPASLMASTIAKRQMDAGQRPAAHVQRRYAGKWQAVPGDSWGDPL